MEEEDMEEGAIEGGEFVIIGRKGGGNGWS